MKENKAIFVQRSTAETCHLHAKNNLHHGPSTNKLCIPTALGHKETSGRIRVIKALSPAKTPGGENRSGPSACGSLVERIFKTFQTFVNNYCFGSFGLAA